MSDRGPEGPEPLPEHVPEPIRYSVAAAAQRLGITERAVRKRIQSGTLSAEPNGRTYWVYLSPVAEPGPEGPEPGPVPLDRNGAEPGPANRADSAQITPAQEASIALVQSMLAPFIAELGDTKEQLGKVTAERNHARLQAEMAILEREQIQAERDALQDRVSALEAQQVESPAQASSATERATDAATDVQWWMFWKRL
jgi:hypothetical protein